MGGHYTLGSRLHMCIIGKLICRPLATDIPNPLIWPNGPISRATARPKEHCAPYELRSLTNASHIRDPMSRYVPKDRRIHTSPSSPTSSDLKDTPIHILRRVFPKQCSTVRFACNLLGIAPEGLPANENIAFSEPQGGVVHQL